MAQLELMRVLMAHLEKEEKRKRARQFDLHISLPFQTPVTPQEQSMLQEAEEHKAKMQKAADKTAAPKTATAVVQPRTPSVTQLPGIPENRTLPVQQADPGPSESDPAAAESSDSPQYSINTHDGDPFELGAHPFEVWSKVENNWPMADWQEVMQRREITGYKVTLPMLVRAFAEHPTEHFFSRSRGARFTAHQVCILTSMVKGLTEELRTTTEVLGGINARLRTLQQEVLENKADAVSRIFNIRRNVIDLEDKFARHLSSSINAPQAEPQAEEQSLQTEAEPELQEATEQAGDDLWPPPQAEQEAEAMEGMEDDAPEQEEEEDLYDYAEDDAAVASGPKQEISAELLAEALVIAKEKAQGTSERPTKRARTEGMFQYSTEQPRAVNPPVKQIPFATFATKCSGRIKIYTGGKGHSYNDWEDHFINVVTAFEMPVEFWTRLATTFLHEDAMRTWKQYSAQKPTLDPLPWTEFSQTMHLYYGDPTVRHKEMIRLDKLVCSHGSLGAFTAYTKDYQQLQMRLGDFDSRITAQHVRQYMKGLPDNVKQIIVTHQVTHPDAYTFLTTGQHLELFLRLGQKYLAAVSDAQPTGAGIATGMRPGRVNTKPARYAKPAGVGRFSQAPVRHSAAARAAPKDHQGKV